MTVLARQIARFLNVIGVLIRDIFHGWRQWTLTNQILSILGLLLLLAALILVPIPSVQTIREYSLHSGPWFPIAFTVLYIVATQFPIPRTVFTVSCGVLFGPLLGCLVALVATTSSAVLTFVLVRKMGRQWIESRLTHPAIGAVNQRLYRRGWLAVGSLRMIGAVPFSILNYICALSRIRFIPFVCATFVGSAPGTIATVFLADAAVGNGNPATIAISATLFAIGIGGLILDAKRPANAHD